MADQAHDCEKRGCKTKKPEILVCMPGHGFAKDEIDTRWFCEACFEEINGKIFRDFQKAEKTKASNEQADVPKSDTEAE